jgi:hypothetical protein
MDYREIFNIPDEKAVEFQQRLRALLNEFEAENALEKGQPHQSWALGVVMYPRFYYPYDEGKASAPVDEQPEE